MKRKFELGQTVYWIKQTWREVPKICESVVNEIRVMEVLGQDPELTYSLSSYYYHNGDAWYIDKDSAERALVVALREEIAIYKAEIVKMKETLKDLV